MREFGDELGFFWDAPIKVGRTASNTGNPVVRQPLRRPPPPSDYKLPTDFHPFSQYKRIALDLETLDPHLRTKGCGAFRNDGHIVGIGVRSPEWAGDYYPVGHEGAPNLDKKKVMDWLRTELAFYTGEITGANLLYDAQWLATEGIYFPFAKIRDVQWAEPLIDENMYSYKLNILAHKYLNQLKITDELEDLYGPSYIENMHKVHPGHMKPYVLGDITLPLLILDLQLADLEKQGLTELYQLESRGFPMLLYMKEQGVKIDLKACENLGVKLKSMELEEKSKIKHLTGREINVWAPEDIGRAYDKLGLPYLRTAPTKTKPNGSPSFTKEWLAAQSHPLAEAIMAVRKCSKFKGTFVDDFLSEAINGRIHCIFHPLRSDEGGTITGRYSSSDPNLQQVPVRDEVLGPLIRGLFIPEDGMRWWSKDFSQIEYRFLVHYAYIAKCLGADVARNMYIQDRKTDFHVFASQITGLPRKPAKNINFGIVYGMGEETMAHNMGITTAAAKPILGTYHEKMPFCKQIYRLASDQAADKGFVKTILGRKGRFPLWEPKKYYSKGEQRDPALPYEAALEKYGPNIKVAYTHKALNKVLQGSSADLTKKSSIEAYEAGLYGRGKPLTQSLTVHDELDGSAPNTPEADEALAEYQNIMETTIPLKVPVLVDGKTGANWAEAH